MPGYLVTRHDKLDAMTTAAPPCLSKKRGTAMRMYGEAGSGLPTCQNLTPPAVQLISDVATRPEIASEARLRQSRTPRAAALLGLSMNDVRAKVRQTYMRTYERSGCMETALAKATYTFAICTGTVPLVGTIDELLRGVILGDDHLLMRLLDVPGHGEQVDDGEAPRDHPLLGM